MAKMQGTVKRVKELRIQAPDVTTAVSPTTVFRHRLGTRRSTPYPPASDRSSLQSPLGRYTDEYTGCLMALRDVGSNTSPEQPPLFVGRAGDDQTLDDEAMESSQHSDDSTYVPDSDEELSEYSSSDEATNGSETPEYLSTSDDSFVDDGIDLCMHGSQRESESQSMSDTELQTQPVNLAEALSGPSSDIKTDAEEMQKPTSCVISNAKAGNKKRVMLTIPITEKFPKERILLGEATRQYFSHELMGPIDRVPIDPTATTA